MINKCCLFPDESVQLLVACQDDKRALLHEHHAATRIIIILRVAVMALLGFALRAKTNRIVRERRPDFTHRRLHVSLRTYELVIAPITEVNNSWTRFLWRTGAH